ncbi:Neurochondrin-domain-containing protein [Plectosphaerella plurivora]|uniref:Neurochondrin-domain-containing protein n=1 Tax=Plectosphaerella plurivora TaxID=936078 RepID=A0A9P8V3G1_9PEZI|nr:Neurochondrin-domain-containing protein [Plectosphaerella plurivora]
MAEEAPDAPAAASAPTPEAGSKPDTSPGEQNTNILDNIRGSLKQKNDTSRFVGLTMLRSFLDSPSELKEDETVLLSLWESISSRFLDRLIKSKAAKEGGQSTIDLGVSVTYKFAVLLPETAKRDTRLVGRIPVLVEAVLHSSEETTLLILQTLLELVTFSEGAQALVSIPDLSPLVEIAPSYPLVLDILERSWLNAMTVVDDKTTLRASIDDTIKRLISSFKGTDGVTLLRFLGDFLRRSHPEALPLQPKWNKKITDHVRNLLTQRPNPEARNAYILVSASLLEVYPADASRLLFASDSASAEKPFSYLFVTLVLTEIRAVVPRLLTLLNDPSYPTTAKRLGSAFDVATHFIAYLLRVMDDMLDGKSDASMMPAEFLLKLRTSLSETLSLAVEFLRDRWDASVAGAMGLHPDPSWTLAIWLREDDNKLLRKEAAGLTDMFLDLYQASSPSKLDFRSPVLVALEGIIGESKGIDAFTTNGGWKILTADLLAILRSTSKEACSDADASRGQEIVRVLMPYAEAEDNGTEEDWMAVVTHVAAWSPPDAPQGPAMLDLQAAVLQLVTTLLVNARDGMRKRYVHSSSAVVGVAEQLRQQADAGNASLLESLDDVITTLSRLR